MHIMIDDQEQEKPTDSQPPKRSLSSFFDRKESASQTPQVKQKISFPNLSETVSDRNIRLAHEFRRFRAKDHTKTVEWSNEDLYVGIGSYETYALVPDELAEAIAEAGQQGDWVVINPRSVDFSSDYDALRRYEFKGGIHPEALRDENGKEKWFLELSYFLKEKGGQAFKATKLFIIDESNRNEAPGKDQEIEIKPLSVGDYEYLGGILTSLKNGDLKRVNYKN